MGAEVAEAGRAAREEVALFAGDRKRAALVGGGEGRDGDAPREARGVEEGGVGREVSEARPYRHSCRGRFGMWIWRSGDVSLREIW